MTSPSGETPLRSRSHGTPGCLPVPDSAVGVHAVVSGDAAKDASKTSSLDLGEANITGASREEKE